MKHITLTLFDDGVIQLEDPETGAWMEMGDADDCIGYNDLIEVFNLVAEEEA